MRVQSQEHAWGRMQQRVIRGSKGLGNKIDPSRGVDVTSLLSDETLLDILGRLPSNPHPCSLVCKRWLRLQGLLRRSIRVKDWAFLESGSMIARFPHLTDVDLTGASVLPLKSPVSVLFSHHFLSIELSPDAYDPTSIERFIRERQLDLSSLDAGLKALADSCPALQKLAMADVSRAPTFHDRISLWRTESWSHHSSALAETETATKKASCDSTLTADPFHTVVKTDCTIKVRDSTDRASVHVSVETEGGVKARDSIDQASVHVSLETEGSIKACDSFDQASVHVSLETEGSVKACDSINQAIVHVSLETDGAVKACNPINGAVKKASIDRASISGALKTEGMVKSDDSNDQACVDVSLETEGAVEACDPNDEVKKASADTAPTSVSLKTEGMVKGRDSVDGASVNASLETDGVVKACDSIDGAPVSTALEIEGAVQKTCDSVDRAPISIAPVTENYDSINGAFVDTSLEMEGTFEACDSIAGAPVSAVPEIEGVVEKACNSVDEVPVSTTPETDRVIRVHDSINAASINASLEMGGAVEACNSIDRAPVSTVSETDGVVEKACNSVDRTPISTTPETGVEKVHDSINGASVNSTLEMEGTLKACDSVDRVPVSITLETGVVKKACDFVDRAPVTTTPEMEEVVNACNSINEASVNASLEADGAVKACDSIETGRVVKKDCNSIDRAPVSTVIESSGVIKARDSINGAAINAMEETGGVVKACDSNGGAAINASQNTEGTVKACNSIDGAPVSTALGIGGVVKACDSINRATISALEETGSLVKEEKLKLELEVKEEEEEERGLAYVAKKCPMLQELKLYQCSDESLGAISGCRNLQIVRLVGSLNGFYRCTFTDVGLTVLARSCRRLVKLGLSGCEASYDGIAAIGKCCPMLEELSLCNQGFYEGWIAALSFCSCLKTLRLEACRQIDPIPGPLEHVGRCAALEHLQLVRCNLKDHPGFTALMLVCSAVRELEFRDCWGLEDEIFSLVCNCPSVRVLSLEGCSLVTTSGLEAVVRTWTKLQTLQVVCCNSIKDSEIGPELATQFILLKELKWRPDAKSQLSVDLAGTGVGQMGGKFFKKGGAG